MKKYLTLLLLIWALFLGISGNFISAQTPPTMEPITTPLPQITVPETKTKSPEELSAEMKALSDKIIADEIAKKKSEEGNTTQSTIGLTMTTECMKGVGCKMDVAKMLGLKAQTPTDDRTSVLTFVQDLVLAATFFIGTIVTLAFIRSWVLFVMSGRDGDSTKRKTAQTGMINAAIGLLLVSASYAIVRLIQYLASGT